MNHHQMERRQVEAITRFYVSELASNTAAHNCIHGNSIQRKVVAA